jgi:hypothetical protein
MAKPELSSVAVGEGSDHGLFPNQMQYEFVCLSGTT